MKKLLKKIMEAISGVPQLYQVSVVCENEGDFIVEDGKGRLGVLFVSRSDKNENLSRCQLNVSKGPKITFYGLNYDETGVSIATLVAEGKDSWLVIHEYGVNEVYAHLYGVPKSGYKPGDMVKITWGAYDTVQSYRL